jgi:hypothetical protein
VSSDSQQQPDSFARNSDKKGSDRFAFSRCYSLVMKRSLHRLPKTISTNSILFVFSALLLETSAVRRFYSIHRTLALPLLFPRSNIMAEALSVSGGAKDDSNANTPPPPADNKNDEGDNWLSGMTLEKYDVPTTDNDNNNNNILNSMQTHPLLQIPVSLSLTCSDTTDASTAAYHAQPIRTVIDTGAQRTILSYAAAQKFGLLPQLDRRYAGHAQGVGHCQVVGRIPAGVAQLHLHGTVSIHAPALTVLESPAAQQKDAYAIDLLIGLDFLREYNAIVDLSEGLLKLHVNGIEYPIPFMRPRSMLDMSTGDRYPVVTVDSNGDTVPSKKYGNQHAANDDEEDDDDNLDTTGINFSGI